MNPKRKHEIMDKYIACLKKVQDKLVATKNVPCTKDMEPELTEAVYSRLDVRKIVWSELFDTVWFTLMFVACTFMTGLFAWMGMQERNIPMYLYTLAMFIPDTLLILTCMFCFDRLKLATHAFVEGGTLLREIDMLCKLQDFHNDPKEVIDRLGDKGLKDLKETLMNVVFRGMKEGKGTIEVVQSKKPE